MTVSNGLPLALKFFVFTNKFRDQEVDSSRGVITVQLSFTAIPKQTLFNLAGILLMTHMRICQFINYSSNKVNDTWTYGIGKVHAAPNRQAENLVAVVRNENQDGGCTLLENPRQGCDGTWWSFDGNFCFCFPVETFHSFPFFPAVKE